MSYEITNNLPPGLYVLSKDKGDVMVRIDDLLRQFAFILSDKQAVAKCKDCIQRILKFLDDCFEDTKARDKCKRIIQSFFTDNANLASEHGNRMQGFMLFLKDCLKYFIPFDDMPSCRSLLDFSTEEAVLKAADLCGNGVIKASAHILSIGSEIYHMVGIADVQRYYRDYLNLFEKDIKEGRKLSSIELLYENKAKMELEYCRLAFLKVSGKLTNDILEISRELINHYQNMIEQGYSNKSR